jgi:hypothetical protein
VVAAVGFQPRLVELLAQAVVVKVADPAEALLVLQEQQTQVAVVDHVLQALAEL